MELLELNRVQILGLPKTLHGLLIGACPLHGLTGIVFQILVFLVVRP